MYTLTREILRLTRNPMKRPGKKDENQQKPDDHRDLPLMQAMKAKLPYPSFLAL